MEGHNSLEVCWPGPLSGLHLGVFYIDCVFIVLTTLDPMIPCLKNKSTSRPSANSSRPALGLQIQLHHK